MSKTKTPPRSRREPAYRLRRSPVHGTGLFATRAIKKGASIIEYLGERISHEEADRRHADKAADDNHTFLFTVDRKTVIDGGAGGNAARFINHSCDPNCEVIIEDGRLFIEALRSVQPGEEFLYDYRITRASDDSPELERIFGCRCGAASCRGTMLAPRRKSKSRKKKAAGRKPKSAASNGRKPKSAGASSARKPKSAASNGQKPKSAGASSARKPKSAAANGRKPKSAGASSARKPKSAASNGWKPKSAGASSARKPKSAGASGARR